ncbi:MAG: hypothetical protein KGK11_07590 [Sphingomonadales bacterium]|nr:hypothetical protein [Sphingomonadales bacterium]
MDRLTAARARLAGIARHLGAGTSRRALHGGKTAGDARDNRADARR